MTSNLEQEIEQFKKSLKHQKDSRQAERERRKVTNQAVETKIKRRPKSVNES